MLRNRAAIEAGVPTGGDLRAAVAALILWECARRALEPAISYWKAKLTGMVTLCVDLLSVMEPRMEWAGEISEMNAPGRIT